MGVLRHWIIALLLLPAVLNSCGAGAGGGSQPDNGSGTVFIDSSGWPNGWGDAPTDKDALQPGDSPTSDEGELELSLGDGNRSAVDQLDPESSADLIGDVDADSEAKVDVQLPPCVPKPEVCNGLDDDCNGVVDDGFPDTDKDGLANCIDWDDDGDNFADEADCSPLNPSIYPGAPELCNGVDDDCDGKKDNGWPDFDGDGVPDCMDGDDDNDQTSDLLDCAPLDPAVHPGAVEVCNGVDDNCDSFVDEAGAVGCLTYFMDKDSDGIGTGDGLCLCHAEGDYKSIWNTDCDDLDPSVSPIAAEICDKKDNDCNGEVDENTCMENCVDDNGCKTGWKCNPETGLCYNMGCLSVFEPGKFSPVEAWSWKSSTVSSSHIQVMATPAVGDINGDGLPEVVFNTFAGSAYTTKGVLRVIKGDGSGELWSSASPSTYPGSMPALGDLDNDGFMEVVVTSDGGGGVHAFDHTGKHLWSAGSGNGDPAIADLNGDGIPEVIFNYQVISPAGQVLWSQTTETPPGCPKVSVADLNGDGFLDLTLGGRAVSPYKPGCPVLPCDNWLLWDVAPAGGFTAVGDLTGGGLPEVVVVSGGKVRVRTGATGALVWEKSVPGGGGGPPIVADFDGDGMAEIGVAGKDYYTVFEGVDGSSLWTQKTTDHSSSVTGSSVFDFDGDSVAEVVYNDEYNLRIYRGTDGTVLFSTPNPSGTLWEYPVIVDVDADNNAEIVVAANDYAWGNRHGIRVFADASDHWVSTRRIWNQHTYHISNILENGKVPAPEPASWLSHNTYRCNLQMEYDPLASPDVLPVIWPADTYYCPGAILLTVAVRNIGTISVLPGVEVHFYAIEPGKEPIFMGEAKTEVTLTPGAETQVKFMLDVSGFQGPVEVKVVVDPDGKMSECEEGNNTTVLHDVGCPLG